MKLFLAFLAGFVALSYAKCDPDLKSSTECTDPDQILTRTAEHTYEIGPDQMLEQIPSEFISKK